MSLADLVLLAVKASIVIVVFSLALKAKPGDAIYLFQRPALLLRSLLAMNVIMPLVAMGLVAAFELERPVEIALVALSISPVPPFLPKKQMKAGGAAFYAIGLLAAAALMAILFVPAVVEIHGRLMHAQEHMPIRSVATIVSMTVLAPLAVGLAFRSIAPALAERIAPAVSIAGTVLLALSALAIIVRAWPEMLSLIGNGTLTAIAAIVVVGLAVGHLLGGPEADNRTVLALSTANRHPGVAIAIATVNVPDEHGVLAAVLLYLLWGAVVSVPYVAWRKRSRPGTIAG